MDNSCYLAEESKLAHAFQDYVRIFWICRHQPNFLAVPHSPFPFPHIQRLNRKLTVYGGNDYITVSRIKGTVNNKKVSIIDAFTLHRIALNADKVGCRRPLNKKLVQVERRLEVLFGRRRESRNYRSGDFCFGTHIFQ